MKGSEPKTNNNPPVFQSWNAWYCAILVVNVLVVLAIYLYVSDL